MAHFSNRLLPTVTFETYMQRQQNYFIGFQPATSYLLSTEALTSTTSLLCDSNRTLSTATAGKTTAALVPSTTFPGVDIVICEIVDNQAL